MSANWSQQEAEAALGVIVKKATTNAEFRQLFLTDPAAAVKEVTGRELPEGFKLRVVENKGAHLTVVLPDPPPQEELSDSDLEAVSGGQDKPQYPAPHCAVSQVQLPSKEITTIDPK